MATKNKTLNKLLTIGSVIVACLLCYCTESRPELSADEFSRNIRTTEARSPADEQAGFQLPPGFEIQLYASEPDIGKPLNMAFDARGRMWLTQSYAYPFADTTGKAKDRISILEDTDQDGRADKITVFAEGLNIPIGIVPVQDGAIAYSIPSIDHFIDLDGDDKVDERKVLYSGFQYKDTHGMINNLVRSWDGWIHADHGFANTSTVTGADGDTIVMNSGNTFRFRADGSRVEFTTTGRVNPYGYAYDELGYTYSSDCHTSPIYQLVRGADYPHFAKKPTGIGFGPALMDHNYGSTALAGLEYYIDTQFPEAYRNSFYLGDVVKSRVYRSTMTMQGTTPQITWENDFIVSEDPWFRPVDVKLGPDGALYVADFYNRIIGHYEVPLDHPGRDRQRGRIWRIVYRGDGGREDTPVINWTEAELTTLLRGLDHQNLPVRMTVADQIVDRFGISAADPVSEILANAETTTDRYVQGLWILFRLQKLSTAQLSGALSSRDLLKKVHALRILFEMEAPEEGLLDLAANALQDESPHVQRQAAMVLSKHPDREHLSALLALRQRVSEEDSHFFYSIRQAIRDQLRNDRLLDWVVDQTWNERDSRALAELMLGVNSKQAGHFLTGHLERFEEPLQTIGPFAKHVGRYGDSQTLDLLVATLQNQTADAKSGAHTIYRQLQEGLAERGMPMSGNGKDWGMALTSEFLREDNRVTGGWRVIPHDHYPYQSNPWRLVERSMGETSSVMELIASGPVDGTGHSASSLRSPDFSLPAALTFFLTGHKNELGVNETPTAPACWVELRVSATDSLIAKALVDDEQMNQTVAFDLAELAGKQGYIHVVDGSSARGEYVAVGGFKPEVIRLPERSPHLQAEKLRFASELAGSFQMKEMQPAMKEMHENKTVDVNVRAEAGAVLFQFDEERALSMTMEILERPDEPLLLKERLSVLLSNRGMLTPALSDLPHRVQKEVIRNLATDEESVALVIAAAKQGEFSARLLQEPPILQHLQSVGSLVQQQQITALTANMPPVSEDVQSLINARLQGFRMQRHSVAGGRMVYGQFCAPCHQLNGEGAEIGPQLNGIGNWGPQALTEKILDPNRNISKAFKNYDIRLKDGQTKAGLFHREEGQLLVFSDVSGQEFSVEKDQIVEQKLSPYTLMPAHFGKVIPEQEYYDLMAYLLNEK